MALARLAFKNLHQRACSQASPCLLKNAFHDISENYVSGPPVRGLGWCGAQAQGMSYGLVQRYSSSRSEGKEVAVKSDDEGGRKRRWRSLLPRRLRKPTSLWRRTKDYPDPFEMLPTASLGNALLEAAENMNRLFDNMLPSTQLSSPSSQLIMGRFKETDDSYKLRYDVPGLTKDDLKVTIDNGVLRIRGERKMEEEDESDDEYMMSYGYYNTSLVLPDDARQDDIKAELKDGVLNVTIPKAEHHGKDVKEVLIH